MLALVLSITLEDGYQATMSAATERRGRLGLSIEPLASCRRDTKTTSEASQQPRIPITRNMLMIFREENYL